MSGNGSFVASLESCLVAAMSIDDIMDSVNKPLMILNEFDPTSMAKVAEGLRLSGDARAATMRQAGDRIVELRKAIRDVSELAEMIRNKMHAALLEVNG